MRSIPTLASSSKAPSSPPARFTSPPGLSGLTLPPTGVYYPHGCHTIGPPPATLFNRRLHRRRELSWFLLPSAQPAVQVGDFASEPYPPDNKNPRTTIDHLLRRYSLSNRQFLMQDFPCFLQGAKSVICVHPPECRSVDRRFLCHSRLRFGQERFGLRRQGPALPIRTRAEPRRNRGHRVFVWAPDSLLIQKAGPVDRVRGKG